MIALGEEIGQALRGSEVIELIGDVGAGKTTFTKGLAKGLGINEPVQSPTFTISRIYKARDSLVLAHYDFYRLHEPGVLKIELAESIANPRTVTIIEWGDIVEGILPENKITIRFESPSETRRVVHVADKTGRIQKGDS